METERETSLAEPGQVVRKKSHGGDRESIAIRGTSGCDVGHRRRRRLKRQNERKNRTHRRGAEDTEFGRQRRLEFEIRKSKIEISEAEGRRGILRSEDSAQNDGFVVKPRGWGKTRWLRSFARKVRVLRMTE